MVLDQNGMGRGASYGNAGLIVPSHIIPLASPGALEQGLRWLFRSDSPFYIKPQLRWDLVRWLWLFRKYATEEHVRRSAPLLRDLLLASQHLTEQITQEEAFDAEFQRNGLLMLYMQEKGRKECERLFQLAQEHDLPARMVEHIEEVLPDFSTPARGGLFFPEDAHLNPAKFVQGLYHVLEERGVRFRPETPVTGFQVEGTRIRRVLTSRGGFASDEVVLAAGAWSFLLGKKIGLRIPVEPAKGYSLNFARPARAPSIPLLLTEAKVAVTPLRETLRLAGTLELAGWDMSINRKRAEAIYQRARRYMPDVPFPSWEYITLWRGLRPASPDGLPVMGHTRKYSNLTLATGHAMIGMSLGAITGKLMAELIAGETPEMDLHPFRLERF